MTAYGFKQQLIADLNDIEINSHNFYTYKDLNFLSKFNSKSENLVISFHGSIPLKNIGKYDTIFRGYDYNIANTDIICISDFLLGKYNKFTVNWTLPTNKHPNTDAIYNEIFEHIISHKKYKNVIFTGTSAGGFPSLKFGSIFNSTVIISNSQLYIENYVGNRGIKMMKEYLDADDYVIYSNKMIEEIILQSPPKRIIYYQNANDNCSTPHSSYHDFMQFKEFIEKNNLIEICTFNLFSESNLEKHQHLIQFPNKKYHVNVLAEFIKNNQ